MYKFRYIFIIVALAFLGSLFVQPAQADSNWHARYWNNRDLAGDPAVDRHEGDKLDHNWGDDSPIPGVINADNFSARWTKDFTVAPGVYRFTVATDDGMRVWIDNNLLIDVWYDSQVHTVTADTYLSSDSHHIRVEYYDAGGGAVASVSWTLVGSGSSGNWYGEYFNNPDLTGSPAYVRQDGVVDFTWSGSPAPGIDADLFSVRWTKTASFETGTYRFSTTTDDGVRLWVNNQLVIDQWQEQKPTTYTADLYLSGNVPIKMAFYDNGGEAVARLGWSKVGATAVAPAPPSQPVITNWRGEYYPNKELSGDPAAVRNDTEIAFVWGSSSPIPNVIPADHFSVRWTGVVPLTGGQYTFQTRTDDGVRLWVNGQLIIDQWQNQVVTPSAAQISLPGGNATIVMEYYEFNGQAEAHLMWWRPGSTASSTTTSTTTTTPPPVSSDGTAVAVMDQAIHLTVRDEPSLDGESIAYLSRNETVTLLGRDAFTIWIQIRRADGTEGWVSGRFLTSSVSLSTLPRTD